MIGMWIEGDRVPLLVSGHQNSIINPVLQQNSVRSTGPCGSHTWFRLHTISSFF